MKKIIYSLVIMIAAGSLFTSCIEPVEPNGLETLRIEKANYLKALAALQQSKTQLVAAQAAAEQALAAQRTAEATYQTALANYQDALTAALRAQTEMDQQRFAIEMRNLEALYEHEALMRALEYDAAVAQLEALKQKYAAEAAEAAVQLALLQAEVNYKELLNEAQRIQNMKDQQEMELAKQAFEQEYGQQAAMFALQLARYEAETAQMAAEAAALVAAQELLNKNQDLQNKALAQEIEQAQKEFEQKYGYQEALNALELARIEAANNAAAKEAEAMLEDLIDQIGYNAAMRALEIARQAVQDEFDAAALEIALKELEEAYNQQVALDAIEIAKAQIDLAKKTLDLEGFAAQIEDLKKNFEYAELYRAAQLQKAMDEYGIDALKAANEIENLKMQQEYDQVLFAITIAQAKQTLKETLDSIDLKNVGLTDEEWARVNQVIRKYEKAYDAYLDQQVVVMQAEADLFNAQYAATHPAEDYYVYILSNDPDMKQHAGLYTLKFAPTVENYEAAIEILRGFIEQDKQAIAELEEKGSLPNDADLRAWAEQLQAWKDQIGKNEYYQYAQTQDSINYMVNVYHDGMAEVAKEVLDWAMEHPYIPAPAVVAEVMEPNLDKIDAMTIDDMPADELEFDTLPLAHGNAFAIDRFSDYSYSKLRHMLSTYPSEIVPHFIKRVDNELTIEHIDRNGVDFILGDPEYKTTDDPLEYDGYLGRYGLEGVYTALAREKVMKEKDPSFVEKAEANYNYTKERFEGDYEILKNGPEAYASAELKAFEDAAKAYKEAKEAAAAADAAKMKTIAEKTKALLNTFHNLEGDNSNFTVYDSTELFNAMHEFAVAREDLGYPAEGDSNFMRYAIGKDTDGNVIEGKIKFSEITMKDVRDGKIGMQYTDATAYGPNQLSQDPTQANVFAYWAKQMLSEWLAYALKVAPMPARTDNMINGNDGDGDHYRAYYNTFWYDTSDGKVKKVGTNKVEPYKPTVVDPTPMNNAAMAAREKLVKYVYIYNRFWAEDVNPSGFYTAWNEYNSAVVAQSGIAAKRKALIAKVKEILPLDVNCYVPETFTEPFTAVIFGGIDMDDIENIIKGEDLNVILTAVDPFCEGNREGVYEWGDYYYPYYQAKILYGTKSRNLKKPSPVPADPNVAYYEWDINPDFSTKATEFTQYLFAWQQYIASQVDLAKDLELLRAWIDSIKAVRDADVAEAEANLEEFKEELKETIMAGYEEALAKHDAAVEAYNKQMEERNATLDAWAEFFGVYDNPLTGKQDTLAYYWLQTQGCQFWPVDTWRDEFATYGYMNNYIDEAAGVWNGPQPGMTNNLIAGTFQEILDANIPGYPEKVAQWNAFARQYADVQYHLRTIYQVMNDAYMAAAKVVDTETTETDFLKYVENYKIEIEEAIAELYDEINEHTAEIEWLNYAIAQINAGVDPLTAWQKVCEMNLEYENQVLADLKTKLDLRQADYDAVMEYINAKSEE